MAGALSPAPQGRNDGHCGEKGNGSWAGSERKRSGLVEVIQQLGQPLRIPEKEPSQHRLKSRGLPIGGRLSGPGTATGAVATTPHQVALLAGEQWLQAAQRGRLRLRLHLAHHSPVQVGGTAGAVAVPQALMQLPHGIPQPGKLEDPQFSGGSRWG